MVCSSSINFKGNLNVLFTVSSFCFSILNMYRLYFEMALEYTPYFYTVKYACNLHCKISCIKKSPIVITGLFLLCIIAIITAYQDRPRRTFLRFLLRLPRVFLIGVFVQLFSLLLFLFPRKR